MQPSQRCYDFIRAFEGYSDVAYEDTGKVWTIGFGTIKYPNGVSVKEGDKCTKEQAQEWLEYEVNEKSKKIVSYIKETPLNQAQFDALTSFVYNVGSNALKMSTLLKKILKNPHDKTIYEYRLDEDNKPVVDSCEFCRWCRDNGRVIFGLLRRRAEEADMYAGK